MDAAISLKEYERVLQQVHELNSRILVAAKTESYMSQEIEALTTAEAAAKKNERIHIEQLDEMRNKFKTANSELAALKEEHEVLAKENAELKLTAEKAAEKQQPEDPLEYQTNSSSSERMEALERENLDLLHKMGQLDEMHIQSSCTAIHLQKSVDVLQDQVNCLKENLRCKRIELDEKTVILESTQDELADTNAKLAALTSAPQNAEVKGNSLFAEVDDQRQAMKQLLSSQKKSYVEMKKIFNENEFEIRRLKRENAAMHTELQACLSIFCSADKVYQDKLNERIRQLMNQNEALEMKVKWTQDRIKDLANAKGVNWLDSMFNFCKQETIEFKQQLHSTCIQKASLEEQLRNTQKEMARWRFESLKLRYTLLDRENILLEHKIAFEANPVLKSDIIGKEMQLDLMSIADSSADSTNQPEHSSSPNEATMPSRPAPERMEHTKPEKEINCDVDKENQLQCGIESSEVNNTLPGPSILCKHRNVFFNETNKQVKFAVNNTEIGTKLVEMKPETLAQAQNVNTTDSSASAQNVQKKANVIVRRVIVNSKSHS